MAKQVIRVSEIGKGEMEKTFFGVLSDKDYEVQETFENGYVVIVNEDGDEQTLAPEEFDFVTE